MAMSESTRGRPTTESRLADETIGIFVASLRPVDKKENTKASADVRVIFGHWMIELRAVSLVATGFHLYRIFIPACAANSFAAIPLVLSHDMIVRIREVVTAEYEKYLSGAPTPGILRG